MRKEETKKKLVQVQQLNKKKFGGFGGFDVHLTAWAHARLLSKKRALKSLRSTVENILLTNAIFASEKKKMTKSDRKLAKSDKNG